MIHKKKIPFLVTSEQWAERATAAHNLLLANATVIRNFHRFKLPGRIGITLNLSPTIPQDPNNPEDVKAATVVDGLFLRWFLDPLFKGKYPEDILTLFQQYNKTFKPTAEDYALFAASKPDFVGVNFYAPQYVTPDKNMPFGVSVFGKNPDPVPMFNGPVRPEYLYKLLMRLKDEYGNPVMLITENGAGFGSKDDSLVNHQVHDSLRTDYIKRHVDTAMQARKDGANLQGYTVWSIFDNFEWIFGYDRRFGIVYVNFKTQERIPKQSYYEYKKIIAANK
jgi:beta-glucosidase